MSRISYSSIKELWSRRDVTPRSRTVTGRLGRPLHSTQEELPSALSQGFMHRKAMNKEEGCCGHLQKVHFGK